MFKYNASLFAFHFALMPLEKAGIYLFALSYVWIVEWPVFCSLRKATNLPHPAHSREVGGLHIYAKICVCICVCVCVSKYVRKLIWPIIVEADPKASFSIATTPRYWRDCHSFLWIAPLTIEPYLIMLSVKQGVSSTKYDSTLDWT